MRKLKSAKREAIAEARQQKTMLAYSDEGDDDDNDDEAREDGSSGGSGSAGVTLSSCCRYGSPVLNVTVA